MNKVNIGNVWKDTESVCVNVGGVWKCNTQIFTNVGGVWKNVEDSNGSNIEELYAYCEDLTLTTSDYDTQFRLKVKTSNNISTVDVTDDATWSILGWFASNDNPQANFDEWTKGRLNISSGGIVLVNAHYQGYDIPATIIRDGGGTGQPIVVPSNVTVRKGSKFTPMYYSNNVPWNNMGGGVTYSVSNTNVIELTGNGLVFAKSVGTSIVTYIPNLSEYPTLTSTINVIE